MSKAISIGIASFFGLLAMGEVLHLGSETLSGVVGILLGVMGVIPLAVLLLAAVSAGPEEPRQRPVVMPPAGVASSYQVLPGTGASTALPVASTHLLSDSRR